MKHRTRPRTCIRGMKQNNGINETNARGPEHAWEEWNITMASMKQMHEAPNMHERNETKPKASMKQMHEAPNMHERNETKQWHQWNKCTRPRTCIRGMKQIKGINETSYEAPNMHKRNETKQWHQWNKRTRPEHAWEEWNKTMASMKQMHEAPNMHERNETKQRHQWNKHTRPRTCMRGMKQNNGINETNARGPEHAREEWNKIMASMKQTHEAPNMHERNETIAVCETIYENLK